MHASLKDGNVAVVTGAASGLGLSAAHHLAKLGLRVVLADLPGGALEAAADEVPGAIAMATDVTDAGQLAALRDRVARDLGPVDVLLANAGIQPGSSILDEDGTWERVIAVNLWGIIRTCQTFAPGMIASGRPGLMINTGSKQGITTPPGDPAYNVSKSGVKTFTEALQHDLRNREGCRVEARLFVPGFVFTPLSAQGRTEMPSGAWSAKRTIAHLFERIEAGDFYILCPDNDVDRATDAKRILWAAGDIAENRPPLSRWHGDYDAAFATWLKT